MLLPILKLEAFFSNVNFLKPKRIMVCLFVLPRREDLFFRRWSVVHKFAVQGRFSGCFCLLSQLKLFESAKSVKI